MRGIRWKEEVYRVVGRTWVSAADQSSNSESGTFSLSHLKWLPHNPVRHLPLRNEDAIPALVEKRNGRLCGTLVQCPAHSGCSVERVHLMELG